MVWVSLSASSSSLRVVCSSVLLRIYTILVRRGLPDLLTAVHNFCLLPQDYNNHLIKGFFYQLVSITKHGAKSTKPELGVFF